MSKRFVRNVLSSFVLISAIIAHGQKEKIEQLGSGIKPPVAIVTKNATFPAKARHDAESAFCLISVTVDSSGNPQNAKVVQCTDIIFAENSIDAVMGYRFKPAIRLSDNIPVAVEIQVEVSYRIYKDHSLAEMDKEVRYELRPPTDYSISAPDADGIYPLSDALVQPRVKKLPVMDFVLAGRSHGPGMRCAVNVVLDSRGRPTQAKIGEGETLKGCSSAVASVWNARFSPARMNTKKVPVRMRVVLTYIGP